MTYELWEIRSGNLMGAFPSQEEALGELRRAIDLHGTEYADTIVLALEDDTGETTTLAEGKALAELACHPTISA